MLNWELIAVCTGSIFVMDILLQGTYLLENNIISEK